MSLIDEYSPSETLQAPWPSPIDANIMVPETHYTVDGKGYLYEKNIYSVFDAQSVSHVAVLDSSREIRYCPNIHDDGIIILPPWSREELNVPHRGGGERQPDEDRLDDEGLDVEERIVSQVRRLGEHSQQLVEAFMKTLPESGGSFAAAEAAIAAATPPPYPFWKDRPKERGATNPVKWIVDHHSDLIGAKGGRAAIGRRDPALIRAYAKHISPARYPDDDLGLDTRELTDLSQMRPEDALKHKNLQVQAAKKRHKDGQTLG